MGADFIGERSETALSGSSLRAVQKASE